MKLTKSKLKQIILEEFTENTHRTLPSIPTVEKLNDLLGQLFNIRTQAKNIQQYEVAGYIDRAINELEIVISSTAAMTEGIIKESPWYNRQAAMEVGILDDLMAKVRVTGDPYDRPAETEVEAIVNAWVEAGRPSKEEWEQMQQSEINEYGDYTRDRPGDLTNRLSSYRYEVGTQGFDDLKDAEAEYHSLGGTEGIYDKERGDWIVRSRY